MRRKIFRILASCLIILVLAPPAYATSSFPDVDEDAPYADAVEYLNSIGVMQGDENGNFNPNHPVSRAEMAAIICRILGEAENLTTSETFTDVPVSHWANGYVAKAASLNIVNGYGDGKFGPSDNVTYEQGITMIIRSAGGEEAAEAYGGYPDGYIFVADENGFLNGVVCSKGSQLLRSDIAIILYNIYS